MAIRVSEKQSSLEKLIFPIDWSRSLLDGVSVVSVNITHTPPSGDPALFGSTIESPVSYIKSPDSLVLGTHFISVVGVTSNPDLRPEVYIILNVDR